MTVEFVKESSSQDQGENLEWASSSDKGGEGDGQAESHFEGASGRAPKSPVDSAVSLRDPDEECRAKYLFALCFGVLNISKSSLDINFGPEGINEKIILVTEGSDQQCKAKSRPFESTNIRHDTSQSDDSSDGNSNTCNILPEAISGIDVI